jgi:hypothetical protein
MPTSSAEEDCENEQQEPGLKRSHMSGPGVGPAQCIDSAAEDFIYNLGVNGSGMS